MISANASCRYLSLGITVEANQGQSDSRVDFLSRGSGYTLFLRYCQVQWERGRLGR